MPKYAVALRRAGERSSRHRIRFAAPLRNGDLCRHCDLGQEASGKWNFSAPKALVLIVISLRGHHATCPDYHCQCITSLVRLGTFHGAWLGPRHLDHGMVARIDLARPGGKTRVSRYRPAGLMDLTTGIRAQKTPFGRRHPSSGPHFLQRWSLSFAVRRKWDVLRACARKLRSSKSAKTDVTPISGPIRTLVCSATKTSASSAQ